MSHAATYERWMRRALALAEKGMGFTSPNPMVGAVLVKRGRAIGEGWHHAAGLAHAEVNAIRDALNRGFDPAGSALVVNLEPCCHVGRTPPCADAIRKAGIKRVVLGVGDPNPCVDGGGVSCLQSHGIEVVTGVLEERCRRLNEPFFHKIKTGRPLVVIKAACSLDGRIATRTGHSQWISGEKALAYSHSLRARYDAICVGVGTIRADNPRLTHRGRAKAGQPLRVILDSKCRTPLSSLVVSGTLPGRTLIATTGRAPGARIAALSARPGVDVAVFPEKNGRVDLFALIDHLGRKGLNSVLFEGGGEVLASVVEERLADRAHIIIAPMLIGGKKAVPFLGGSGAARIENALRLEDIEVKRLGADVLIRGKIGLRVEG